MMTREQLRHAQDKATAECEAIDAAAVEAAVGRFLETNGARMRGERALIDEAVIKQVDLVLTALQDADSTEENVNRLLCRLAQMRLRDKILVDALAGQFPAVCALVCHTHRFKGFADRRSAVFAQRRAEPLATQAWVDAVASALYDLFSTRG